MFKICTKISQKFDHNLLKILQKSPKKFTEISEKVTKIF